MPLYEYACRKCQHEFETLVSSRTEKEIRCPVCESEQLDRFFGLPAVGRATAPGATNCRGDGPPCGASWCGRKP